LLLRKKLILALSLLVIIIIIFIVNLLFIDKRLYSCIVVSIGILSALIQFYMFFSTEQEYEKLKKFIKEDRQYENIKKNLIKTEVILEKY